MKKFLTIFICLLGSSSCFAQYTAGSIPESLLKNADMVKRLDELRVEIKSPGKAIYYRHYIYTILNEAAEGYAYFYDYYDKFRSIESISGTLYDAAGNKIKNVKKKDIADETGNSGGHLAYDERYKVHNFYYKNYPYTVEYEVAVTLNGILYLPEWEPAAAPKIAVEKSLFTVTAPKDYELRYKQFRYNGAPVIKDEKSVKTYTWQLSNQTAKKEEDFAPEWDEITTRVLIAPSDFEIAGYKGNMNSWQRFGKFITDLYSGRDVLPVAVKTKVHELTDNLKTDTEKINALYHFLQDNTHYISIQLGIGGWQPLDATYVAEKKYGDCKALSNYMVALLKEAGIKAHNVLIKAGTDEKDILTDFPSNQFNHVVVCVPRKPARSGDGSDTTWLECTSQTVSPGYMGNFTGNREALLVDENNSAIVRTPVYAKAQNLQTRTINATIDAEGKLNAKVATLSTGLQQDNLHGIINNTSREEQQKRLRQIFSLPNYDVPAFTYYENKTAAIPGINETMEIISNNYASVTGKRMFVKPNILSTYTAKLNEEETRENDIVYTYAFIDKDTVNISLPEGYKIESMPKPLEISNKFGRYDISYNIDGNMIKMTRSYERNSGRFPASDYKEFVAFYNAIYKADNARMVFVKNE
ncbi:MAG: DUF3857 domain-containing protein [Niabella sp.]